VPSRPIWQGTRALTISLFLGSFAWAFAFISLPFYVQAISTSDARPPSAGPAGSSASVAVRAHGPAWGRVAAGGDPKLYYVLIQLFQGAGFSRWPRPDLFELFVARFALVRGRRLRWPS
jgi:hypothetical protein